MEVSLDAAHLCQRWGRRNVQAGRISRGYRIQPSACKWPLTGVALLTCLRSVHWVLTCLPQPWTMQVDESGPTTASMAGLIGDKNCTVQVWHDTTCTSSACLPPHPHKRPAGLGQWLLLGVFGSQPRRRYSNYLNFLGGHLQLPQATMQDLSSVRSRPLVAGLGPPHLRSLRLRGEKTFLHVSLCDAAQYRPQGLRKAKT